VGSAKTGGDDGAVSTDPTTVTSRRGNKLVVHHLGGSGDVLLIVHATGFHARCYLPMVETLAQRFNVWAVDMPGHGASELPPDMNFGWAAMAGDLIDVIATMGWKQPYLFGHSMGGAVSLAAALEQPDIAQAVYVYEPIVFPEAVLKARGQHVLADSARRRRETFANRGEAMARFASRPPLNVCRSDALHAYVEYGFTDLDDGTVQLACRGESEALTYESDATDIDARAAEITVPTTIAYGGDPHPPSPAALAPALAKRLPNGKLKNFANLGHFGPMEAPSVVAAHVVRSLSNRQQATAQTAK
jgi:pimeloyl-ACP methyl ester carboxylesterase